jgi:hypothetical protein
MKKMFKISLFLILTTLIVPFGGFCDTRTENIDVFLVLDKSLSMVEEIEAVKSYNKFVSYRPHTHSRRPFYRNSFLRRSENSCRRDRADREDKDVLKKKIGNVLADGRFTDIGNALDTLKTTVDSYGTSGRRRFLLLITDGKQEAPPESIYYSKDGSFNHQFLENTKIIQKEGWKIHILGIGSAQVAKEIAKELSGTYAEIEGQVDGDSLTSENADFLSTIDLVSPVSVTDVPKDGKARIGFRVKSSGYSEDRTLTIEELWCEMQSSSQNILESPYSVLIPPGTEVEVTIPVRFSSLPEAGQHKASLRFIFDGRTVFVPAYAETMVTVNGFFKNNLLYIIGAAILLVLLIVVFIIIRNAIEKKKEEKHTKLSLKR